MGGSNTIPFTQLGIPFDSLSPTQQSGINIRGGPTVALVTVTQQVNAAGTLIVQGYEANWVQPLSVVLKGLGFSANYTKVAQQSQGTGINPQATGISPTTYNGTVYYENFGFMVRASYTHSAPQVLTAANTGGQNGIPSAQLFNDAYSQLDISAGYTFADLPSSPQVTLNVTNALSETQRATFMQDNATFTFYDPGYSVTLGVRGTF